MRINLRISVLLNLVLAGWLVVLEATGSRRATPQGTEPVAPQPSPQGAGVVPGGSLQSGRFEPPRFQWSQIESPDYPTYITNLRAIGCPEQTIRDIIVADVGSLYASRREQLASNEETALIAVLLSARPPARTVAEATAEGPPPSRVRRQNAQDSTCSLPLVFQDVDFGKLNLGAVQLEMIGELRRRFLEEVGDPNQDADSSAYRERWRQAQPQMDEMLRGFVGANAYQDYELAARTSAGAETPGKP